MEDKPIDQSKLKGVHSSPGVKVTAHKTSKLGKYCTDNNSSLPEAEEGNHQINAGSRTKRQKFLPFKLRMDVSFLSAFSFFIWSKYILSSSSHTPMTICKLLSRNRFQNLKIIPILIWTDLRKLRCVICLLKN